MEMFEKIEYLLLLLCLIPLWALYKDYAIWRNKAIQTFGEQSLVLAMFPAFSEKELRKKLIFFALSLVCFIIALANPQGGQEQEKVKRRGIDVLVALDISYSMMAEDVKPRRLDRAKQLIQRISDKLKGDRIGLIVFAGSAFMQSPLTTDYAATKLFLKTVSPDMMSSHGTAIADAMQTAELAFEENNGNGKALIIISDGEDHEGDAEKLAAELSGKGIRIFTVGIGSAEGSTVPEYENGMKKGEKNDETGKVVLSKLNEETLKTIAEKGNGSYLHFSNETADAQRLVNALDKLEKTAHEEYQTSDKKSFFQWFIALGLLFLSSLYIDFSKFRFNKTVKNR